MAEQNETNGRASMARRWIIHEKRSKRVTSNRYWTL